LKAKGTRGLAPRLAAVAASMLFLLTLTMGIGAAAQMEFVQVLSIDDYSKEVTAGSSATYSWTIMNVDPDANLTVEISASISGKGWTCEVTDTSVTLTPDELETITVTVTAPLESGSDEANLTVALSVYDGDHLVQVSSVGADTALIGAFASANKVLGGTFLQFDNPLPSSGWRLHTP
jgi:uncharacterized protein YfaS (alpha-2-macroglobulin family)